MKLAVLVAMLVVTSPFGPAAHAAPNCPRNVLPELCQRPLDNDVEMTSDANGNAIISVFGGVVRIKAAEKMPIPLHLHEVMDRDTLLGRGVELRFMNANLIGGVTFFVMSTPITREMSTAEHDKIAADALEGFRKACESPRILGPAKPFGSMRNSWEWTCTSKRMFTSNTQIYRSTIFIRQKSVYLVNSFAMATPSADTPKINGELRLEIAPP
jgi:hypothetical protein